MEKKRKSGGQDTNEIINSAIESGLGVLVRNHPGFGQEYIQKHIDPTRLNEQIKYIYGELKKEKLSEKEIGEYLHKGLTDYVASGGAFDEKAKEAVIEGGLEEKAKSWNPFKRFSARRELEGEKKFNTTIEASRDLYSIFKTGDYAQRMPELAQAVQTIYDAGFFDSLLKVLKSHGLMDKKKYALLKENIRKGVQKNYETIVEREIPKIENYFYPQAAAILIGLIGALMVFTSSNMTGGVIGTLGSNGIKIIGAGLFFIALVVFFKMNRMSKPFRLINKKKKSKTFKNR